jgi:hypothetical protein
MGSVRSRQYDELLARQNSGRLKGFSFLHLKKELDSRDIDWIHCNNPKQLSNQQLRNANQQLTTYGVMKCCQEKIASLRTDLDSFSDTEAYALMFSGFSMARTYIAKDIHGFHTNQMQQNWDFLNIKVRLQNPSPMSDHTQRLLDVGKHLAFKIWRLSPILATVSALIALAVFVAVVLGFFGVGWIMKVCNIKKSIYQVLIPVGLCIFGAGLAWTHVWIFDKLFLKKGRVK